MIKLTGKGNARELAEQFTQEMEKTGLSCQLVSGLTETHGDTTILVQVYEKYYMRASNRVSLTFTLISNGETSNAYVVSSGGGQGPIFRMSWGAEEDFALSAAKILSKLGFKEVDA